MLVSSKINCIPELLNNMNKYQLIVSVLLSTSTLVWAGPKQKKVDNWVDASVKAKKRITREAEEGRYACYFAVDEA